MTIIFFRMYNKTQTKTEYLHQKSVTPALALHDPFGVDVPLNFDITHSPKVCFQMGRDWLHLSGGLKDRFHGI